MTPLNAKLPPQDISNEEILNLYILFLKTLSMKFEHSTVDFFYNEHERDFPLYAEAIKYFDNSESHIRVAVRTILLNMLRVDDVV